MNKKLPMLTVICPVFNEAEVIPLFFKRFLKVCNQLKSKYLINLLFINNASTDKTYHVIQNLMEPYKFIYLITLSSNVGYQKSLDCGIRNAKGDLICFIDVDCEDPREMILDFINLYEKGYDLVYGIRLDRHEHRLVIKARNYFYYLLRKVADDDVILFMAEFCLMTSEVRNAVVSHQSSFPFIRSCISRVGFKRIGIEYKRERRIAGETHYNLFGMIIFAIAGILSSSTLPLRLPIYVLPFWILGAIITTFFFIKTMNLWYLFTGIVISIFYFGFSIAFIALYIARAYRNTLNYPNYFINHKLTRFQ